MAAERSSLDELIAESVARAVDAHMAQLHAALADIKRALPTRLLTVKQAAEALGCHPSTVRRMVATGELRQKRVGKAGVRIDSASINGNSNH